MLKEIFHTISAGIELLGVIAIIVGVVSGVWIVAGRKREPGGWEAVYQRYRMSLGRGILFGLELLVAADIIGTVLIEPTVSNLAVLALIVLIRTFLSFALQIELEGRLPWRGSGTPALRRRQSGADEADADRPMG
ncbi:DUF1622 domain-containing protein [Acuticoccus kandeliae]|uniref:DUF1622 domain-containing protein n=1 Tax=Acuticoccus kandeliae TaxID=2073160 RepID=UPI000D3ED0DE|nr:DUF1622 domain-containing protein [Acuticoccus kandeliae]